MLVAEALQQGRFPPGRAVSVALQVAHEIASAHRKEQLRLSLSTRELELRGEDLDLAPPGKASTEYSAPEQLAGLGVDRRTDVFLVGALLYHLVTGHRPPPGQKVAPPPIPPEDGLLEIFVIIDHCLEPNRDARYSNMESLVEDLQAVRRLLETLASKAPVGEPIQVTADLVQIAEKEPTPPSEERERSSSGMILVLVICLTGTVVFWWFILR
jgi:serine/threonine protein kinase